MPYAYTNGDEIVDTDDELNSGAESSGEEIATDERDGRIEKALTWRDRKNRRLEIYYRRLDMLLEAEKSISAGVQAYSINGKSLTRYDLQKISVEIDNILTKIERLECDLSGSGRHKAVGVIPRDL